MIGRTDYLGALRSILVRYCSGRCFYILAAMLVGQSAHGIVTMLLGIFSVFRLVQAGIDKQNVTLPHEYCRNCRLDMYRVRRFEASKSFHILGNVSMEEQEDLWR